MNKGPFNPPNMCTMCGGYNHKAPKAMNPKKCECGKKEPQKGYQVIQPLEIGVQYDSSGSPYFHKR
jgi:hypothetical protein